MSDLNSPKPEDPSGAPPPGKNTGDRLLMLVYDQLRAIAQEQMRAERGGHTLQATALVHEAYIRLVKDRQSPWQSKAHFLKDAAKAMERILIEHARKRQAEKRGGNYKRTPINSVLDLVAEDRDPKKLLAVMEAFERFREENEHSLDAAVFSLRFFAGRSEEETAEALEISERTVQRRWKFARAWLRRRLESIDGESASS